jgi:hypothetical protein
VITAIDLTRSQSILDCSNPQSSCLAFADAQSCRHFPNRHPVRKQFSRTPASAPRLRGAVRGRIAKIAKPTIEISDKVRLNLEKFV